ncbi:MAG: metal-dependent hydrolase [Desulfobacterales bacterium]|jgi:membrane-bound metal-dependent hydrolase YbcI (DUF457 family)
MPLPLGHAAIGLAVAEITQAPRNGDSRLFFYGIVCALASLPDIDILLGLLTNGNGSLFHRGPTHSLLFALFAGWLFSEMGRSRRKVPLPACRTAVMVVLSHVVADLVLTDGSVSLLWPLDVHWSAGVCGWTDVIETLIVQSLRDAGIAGTALGLFFAIKFARKVRLISDQLPADS